MRLQDRGQSCTVVDMTTTRNASSDYSPEVLAGMSTQELAAERNGMLQVLNGSVPMPRRWSKLYAADALEILDSAIAAR